MSPAGLPVRVSSSLPSNSTRTRSFGQSMLRQSSTWAPNHVAAMAEAVGKAGHRVERIGVREAGLQHLDAGAAGFDRGDHLLHRVGAVMDVEVLAHAEADLGLHGAHRPADGGQLGGAGMDAGERHGRAIGRRFRARRRRPSSRRSGRAPP